MSAIFNYAQLRLSVSPNRPAPTNYRYLLTNLKFANHPEICNKNLKSATQIFQPRNLVVTDVNRICNFLLSSQVTMNSPIRSSARSVLYISH